MLMTVLLENLVLLELLWLLVNLDLSLENLEHLEHPVHLELLEHLMHLESLLTPLVL